MSRAEHSYLARAFRETGRNDMTSATPPTPPDPTPPSDTPIADELAAAQQTVAPDATQAAAPVVQAPAAPAPAPAVPDEDEDDEGEGDDEEGDAGPKTAKSYKVDVKRALARETHDGKGEEDPGPSDWVSYATEGVEVEDGK